MTILYKQTEGRNQPMQLDLLKVSSRSTSTPTPKVGGRSQKGLYFDCVYSYKDRVLRLFTQKGNLDSNFSFLIEPDTSPLSCLIPTPSWSTNSTMLA
jgi:hypothetical protein